MQDIDMTFHINESRRMRLGGGVTNMDIAAILKIAPNEQQAQHLNQSTSSRRQAECQLA
jgi:hypothetical protein